MMSLYLLYLVDLYFSIPRYHVDTNGYYQRMLMLVSPLHVDSKIVDASHIPKVSCLYVNFVRIYLKIYAFLAQLDRAIVFEAIGCKFDSCRTLGFLHVRSLFLWVTPHSSFFVPWVIPQLCCES